MLLEKLLRAGDAKTMRRIEKLTDAVESLESFYAAMDDEELQSCTQDFKNRLEAGETEDQLIPEAFAVSREASRRVLGKFPYRVQIIGGIALHLGNIAEMATGSGKAVPTSEPIPTPDGWRLAGDIAVGDTIFDRWGDYTTVTGVFPQGEQPVYEVRLENGRTVRCNAEHLWTVYTDPRHYGATSVLTTQEILERGGVGVYRLPSTTAARHPHNPAITNPFEWGQSIAEWGQEESWGEHGNPQQRWEVAKGIADAHFKAFALEKEGGVIHRAAGLSLPTPEAAQAASRIFHSLALPVTPTGEPGELVFKFSANLVDQLLDDEPHSPFPYPSSPAETITAITATGETLPQVCFSVDNDERMFLVGEYVPTHNTLTAVAPSYLNALSGKGVHVVTTNDYLASTQQEDMGRVYSFLGLSSAVILNSYTPEQRRTAYGADITYGTNNEFGFDYLRDNLVKNRAEKVQRGHNYIIVDEADSILIDDAKTPLIISGQPEEDGAEAERWFKAFAQFAPQLRAGRDYEVDFKKKVVDILEPALDKVEDWLGIENLYLPENAHLVSFLYNAIRAKELFRRNYEYVVRDGEVFIVDPSTGRTMPGRRYSDGLHQALEAKEGVKIQPESMTTSSITLQAYVGLYSKVSGMTGTAYSESAEMMDTYKLGVIQVPNHRPIQRIEHEDSMFVTDERKYRAIVEDVAARHATGQPILIGTASVEKSERLSKELAKAGIRHEVLNANNHAREAAIIAQAGRKGSVTVATNMAGRGTDILLGGNPEFDAKVLAEQSGINPHTDLAKYNEFLKKTEAELTEAYKALKEEVIALGGLCVIGTERHESRRIDDQLRGRSGRQGDPGEAKFYLSLDDQLVERFGGGMVQTLRRMDPEMELSSKTVSRIIQNVQGQIKEQDAEQRKNSMKYDEAFTLQREAVYRDRDAILESENPHGMMCDLAEQVFDRFSAEQVALKAGRRDLETFTKALNSIYPSGVEASDLEGEYGDIDDWDITAVVEDFKKDYLSSTDEAAARVGDFRIQAASRVSLLEGYDSNYPLHLAGLDYLKQGIGLRALAQKNPVHEYLQESNKMYAEFMEDVRRTATSMFFSQCQRMLTEPVAVPGVLGQVKPVSAAAVFGKAMSD